MTTVSLVTTVGPRLGDYPTGVVDDDVLVFGDLNSYAQEDPIDVLRDAGYVTFSETVTGLLVSELLITGRTTGYAPTLTTSDNITWSLTFVPNTPKAQFNAKQVTVSVPEGVAVDAAGNTNTASPVPVRGGSTSQVAE
jgi:hypothetical protein